MFRFMFRSLLLMVVLLGCGGMRLSAQQVPTLSSQEALAKVLAMRDAGDAQGAIGFLAEQLDERARMGSRFGGLYEAVWVEAQVRSGRLDQDWAASLYNQLFVSCEKHKYYRDMNDVMGNLLSTLGGAGRHGRKTEILEWWATIQRPAGKQLNFRSYKDLGPALPFLPEVRLRDVPEEVLYWRPFAAESKPIPKVNLGQHNASLFIHYSDRFAKSGRWVEAMEWDYQLRRWASLEDGKPKWQLIQAWFGSVESIANCIYWHGFHEEALAQVDEALAAPMQESYHGRQNIMFNLTRLMLLKDLDRAPEDIVEQAQALAERAAVNKHLSINSAREARRVVAKALLHKGRDSEALAILNELSAVGFTSARESRLVYWLDHGQLEQVEEELLSLLSVSRDAGNKSSEAWLYEMYADFLEKVGRLDEALAMRREVIRLYRGFNHFTKVPIQLAKLALLLERMGDPAGSKAAADEARALLAQGRLPKGRFKLTMDLLAKLGTLSTEEDEESEDVPVDVQPERSIVIPIQGAPWTTMLTLTNPSGIAKEGVLSCRGLPMKISREGEQEDVVLRSAQKKHEDPAELKLRLEPKSYELIKIIADRGKPVEGELALVWTPQAGEDPVEAKVQIEAPEKGITRSIIQAGNYRSNAFYGVPIYLHYVSKLKEEQSPPMRFVTSQKARVEVYALDGTPLSVDGQGNGSLWDRGDELFGSSDQEGNLVLDLKESAASIMVVLYPDGPLPEEGLALNVDVKQDGQWVANSQNRLMP